MNFFIRYLCLPFTFLLLLVVLFFLCVLALFTTDEACDVILGNAASELDRYLKS